MLKVLAICGNGMGTSMIIKMKVQNYLNGKGISADVDSCALGEASGKLQGVHIALCSKHLADQVYIKDGQHLLKLTNLMDEKEFGPALDTVIAENFS
ncbi:MAG: PTS sugar transporter subunit IIB [Alphaproteobacteria bacterium]